jgi:predicted Zn-dependent peptidase
VGDYQTLGLACGFMDDRFVLRGDEILAPMAEFLIQLLRQPLTEGDGFCREYVRQEKKNMISALEAQRNDKAAYASGKLLKIMCKGDSFAIPRLGKISGVRKITARNIYTHYETVLKESPVEIFYVGPAPMERVAKLLTPMFADLQRQVKPLLPQTPLRAGKPACKEEYMDIAQAKIAMGFATDITNRDNRFAAMQLLNSIFGSGMTSKLFMKVREEKSLCYSIGSAYYGSKGIMTVHAGVDSSRCQETKTAILEQLEACRRGEITQQELESAKMGILSGLRAVYDSPGAMENFFSTAIISGLNRSPETYAEQIRAVTLEDVVEAANTVMLHSTFFLKGESHGEEIL